MTWRIRSTILSLAAVAALMAAPSAVFSAPPSKAVGSAAAADPTTAPESQLPAAASPAPTKSAAAVTAPTPGTETGSTDPGDDPYQAPSSDPAPGADTAPAGETGDGAAPAASLVQALASSSPDLGNASPSARKSADPSLSEPALPLGADLASIVLGFGLLGVAAIALIGLVWVALGRQRPEPQESVDTSSDTVLARRALRRATLRDSDDPILAALGLSESPPRDTTRRRATRRPEDD